VAVTILVIDEQDRFKPVLELTYKGQAVNIVGAKAISRAKQMLIQSMPDLIISSYNFRTDPEGGANFCEELSKHPLLSQIPVLLVANELTEPLIKRSGESGAKGLMGWPATVGVIRNRVSAILGDINFSSEAEIPAEPTKPEPKTAEAPAETSSTLTEVAELSSAEKPSENMELVQRLLAQVLHNIRTRKLSDDLALEQVPELVVAETKKVCECGDD
jgi:response regulator RpfG family c-di-GMP phosphodiesterase